jgi:hypothetical protein
MHVCHTTSDSGIEAEKKKIVNERFLTKNKAEKYQNGNNFNFPIVSKAHF